MPAYHIFKNGQIGPLGGQIGPLHLNSIFRIFERPVRLNLVDIFALCIEKMKLVNFEIPVDDEDLTKKTYTITYLFQTSMSD